MVKSREKTHCPCCGGDFKVIGSSRRVLINRTAPAFFYIMMSGEAQHLLFVIGRLRCADCRRISHELPDMVVPYKH